MRNRPNRECTRLKFLSVVREQERNNQDHEFLLAPKNGQVSHWQLVPQDGPH